MSAYCFVVTSLVLLVTQALVLPQSVCQKRDRRSLTTLIKLGRAALHGISSRHFLVSGAELLRTFGGDWGVKRIYLKFGGGKRAKEDFYSVNPINVKVENMGQLHIGEIGNRQIALSLQDSFGSITITKHDKGKEIVDEIRYRNQEIEERSYDWLNFG